ncbi:MAG: Smr/MutS family protein [Bacteroidales bacterium]|jgi:DNA mismatch repair protein MutS2|nr:Smr/MutS family protein [Bacteroidales bacterium]
MNKSKSMNCKQKLLFLSKNLSTLNIQLLTIPIFAKFFLMIYPDSFQNKIGFDVIKQKITALCLTKFGKYYAENISFSSDFNDITNQLSETDETRKAILFHSPFPLNEFSECLDEIIRLKTKGTVAERDRLQDIFSTIKMYSDCYKYFNTNKEDLPLLHEIFNDNFNSNELIKLINVIVDEKGEIKDNASSELYSIRKKLQKEQLRIDKELANILKNMRIEGVVKDDCEATIRNGRLVIPVPAGNKKQLKGFIHDTSATGQTVYIEPSEVFNINNSIRELMIDEKQEIFKILREFTEKLRPQLENIEEMCGILAYIDFLKAKAKFAIEINAIKPILIDLPKLEWRNAIHPLLYLSLKNQKRKVVPLNIIINEENRIIVISGPNAGGKSIALKTVALLQYMLQCGILIPLGENSETGIFENIFIDIGDEQSIENDLSTYTSHLKNIKFFIENADENTLILIDEFGTGTEPQLGSIIAEESLKVLRDLHAKGIITTHYANIKKLAQELPGLQNAAMLFDTENIKPLFEISIGNPGSSYTFEIARRVGFPENILDNAVKKSPSSQLDFERQLQELIIERKNLEKERNELKTADQMLSEVVNKYTNLLNELETNKKEIIKQAKSEAQEIIKGANKKIENAIQEIRAHQAEKEKTKKIRENLNQVTSETVEKNNRHETSLILEEHKQQFPLKLKKDKNQNTNPVLLKVGNLVKSTEYQEVGEITDIKGKKAKVNFSGNINIWMDIEKLKVFDGEKSERIRMTKNNVGTIIHDINQRAYNFSLSIDVRGKRTDEALEIIKKYVDDAIMLHITNFKILHGKGNGILRTNIRDYLRTIDEVVSINDEDVEHGGDGITIVEIK